MSDEHPDPLELCTNANFIADALAEYAENKREKCGNRRALQAGPETWAGRLDAWAERDDQAAATIRALVAGIERLRRESERLTRERDAAVAYAAERVWDVNPHLWPLGKAAGTEEAKRRVLAAALKAAGLDPEGGAP